MAVLNLDDIFRVDHLSKMRERGRFVDLRLRENVISALQNRLSTPKGRMPFNPNYGTNVKRYLGEAMTPEVLSLISNEHEQQCLRDFRVSRVVSITTEPKGSQVVSHITLTLVNTNDNLEFRVII